MLYYEQRLALLYMTGEWPSEEMDHRSLDKADNRWRNIRRASHSQNKFNRPKLSTNTSGYKGVYSDRRDRCPNSVADAVEEQARADTRRVKIAIPVDPGQAGLAQKDFYVKLLNGFTVDFSPESGDKVTRSTGLNRAWALRSARA